MEDNNAPTPSLSRGEYTFMPQRLENILKYERFAAYNETDAGIRKFQGGKYGRPEIRCESSIEYFEFEQCDGGLRCYGDQRARLRAANFCQWLYGHASPVSIEVKELDAALSKVFRFKFDPLTKSHIFVEQACDLLERMPAWPPELLDVPTSIPLGYRASSLTGYANKDRRLWQKLQATTFVNGTVLRFALRAVMIGPSTSSHDLLDIINVVSFLLETVSNLAQSVTHIGTLWRSFIVRAFLWTTWQRCQLIYYHIATIHTLKNGSDDGKIAPLTLRGSFPSPGMTLTEMSKQNSGISKAAYMCGWNFELLRIKSFCIGADFRRFHQRYTSAFGKHTARCFVSQQIACKGESPRSCQRFHGMKIDDQSMHDEYCSGSCTQLIWDESSYRRVSGPRAVRLKRSDHNACESIQYCNASERTLAISHVWSQ